MHDNALELADVQIQHRQHVPCTNAWSIARSTAVGLLDDVPKLATASRDVRILFYKTTNHFSKIISLTEYVQRILEPMYISEVVVGNVYGYLLRHQVLKRSMVL